jgi:hypothetical protein
VSLAPKSVHESAQADDGQGDCPVAAPVQSRADEPVRLRIPAAPPALGQVGADQLDVGRAKLAVDVGLDHRLESAMLERIHALGTRPP